MNLEISEGRLKLRFDYHPKTITRCHQTGVEMKWMKSNKYWWLPDNKINRKVISKAFPELNYVPDDNGHNPTGIKFIPPDYMMAHQKEALKFSDENPRHLFAHRTGTGKTVIGIEIIRSKLMSGHIKKTLVVCPLSIINPAWMEDINRFAPELRAVNLWEWWGRHINKFKERIEWMDVGIINFESFKKCKRYLKGVDMVLVDESSKIKNMQAQITQQMVEFCDDVSYVYLFSGTPAPNSSMEYFSQARIVDPTIFGRSFYKFRNKYYYSAGYGGFTWIQKSDYEFEMMDRIASFSSVVRKRDVLDLPPRTFNVIDVHLSAGEKKAYKEMVDHLIAVIEEKQISAYNAAVKGMKLRQITAGFLINEEGEVKDFGNSKMNVLLDLLEQIGDEQVIIWTQFIHEAKLIALKLQKLNKTYGMMIGEIKHKDRDQNIKDFKAGDRQYLIAHPATMAHGFTLTNCTYAVYYSLSYSHEEHLQSQDRIYRRGTSKPCSYYYLLAPGTIDKVIYACLRDKRRSEESVLNHIKASRF